MRHYKRSNVHSRKFSYETSHSVSYTHLDVYKRQLVDRLWPRGISKEKASWDEWLKNVAPSTALRQWFAHDPAKWDAFRRTYDEELDGNKEAVSHLLQLARKGTLTLLYSARERDHNEAAALRDYLCLLYTSRKAKQATPERHCLCTPADRRVCQDGI